ncbi:MAG: hypothetical protein ABI920_10325 [Casimicrobiaceae bacterium]
MRGYLAQPLDLATSRQRVVDARRTRQASFLAVLERGVYGHARSPYRRLLEHAGITFAEAVESVTRQGIEATLATWHARGVYVTVDEFKGRVPIVRGAFVIDAQSGDFDNPLLVRHYESMTGGSRGPRTRLAVDLDLLVHEAAQTRLFMAAFGIEGRPIGIWRDVIPGAAGIKTFLRHAKLGDRVLVWFTPRKALARLEDLKYQAFMIATALISRLAGQRMPTPRYVPPREAGRVAAWLAEHKARGQPAILDTSTSTAVRTCIAASALGIDIAGSLFRVSAEPYTITKDAIVRERGCRTASHYSCAEVGYLGMACANPEVPDEVHLMTDKVALIQVPKAIGNSGHSVNALVFSTVLPSCPKLMLNVELGDYAEVTRRRCGCLFEELGFDTHLAGIRSWEKLNSAGVTFLGTELIVLVEDVLPKRFGGHAMDYQFVEEEEEGIPKVTVVMHPRLGEVDEAAVVDAVLSALQACPGGGLMTDTWRNTGTLRVRRVEPHVTGAYKLLPLHVLGTTSRG